MALAITGGMPECFATFAGLYREGARHAGKDPASLRLPRSLELFASGGRPAALAPDPAHYLRVRGIESVGPRPETS